MPYAPQIRRYILRILDETIIPALRSKAVKQILAGRPWDFSQVEHWILQKGILPHHETEPTQMVWNWQNEKLIASRIPFIGFIYKGISDDKVGITAKMANIPTEKIFLPGITVLRLPAPSIICFPPGVPRRDGSAPYCDYRRPGFSLSRTLWMHIAMDEILVHYCESDVDRIFSSHSLQINDPFLAQMAHVYMDELRFAMTEGYSATQGLMLLIMKRLHRHLSTYMPSFTNTAWPHLSLPKDTQYASKSEALCGRTVKYLDTHLRDSLTWKTLARQMGVSPSYLNYAFRRVTGMPVMRYVQTMRIESAKLMLSEERERIGDIARLTGFSNLASFSASFKRYVGCSPSEFRRQAATKKSKALPNSRLEQ